MRTDELEDCDRDVHRRAEAERGGVEARPVLESTRRAEERRGRLGLREWLR